MMAGFLVSVRQNNCRLTAILRSHGKKGLSPPKTDEHRWRRKWQRVPKRGREKIILPSSLPSFYLNFGGGFSSSFFPFVA